MTPLRAAARPLRPKKSLGQHFLSDRNIIDRIVDAADLAPGDAVLEVGPGPGEMTAVLAERKFNVTAVEIDRALAAVLKERFAQFDNVRVLEMDALEMDPATLFGAQERYVVVANLPYNVGTAIVRRLLESARPPDRLVVMLQKEVARAMVAPPGDLSLVSIGVQVYASGQRLFDVPPGAFRPPPKVTSSVIRLDKRPEPIVPSDEREQFFRVVRAGFSAPRKQLRNSLMQGLGMSREDITSAIGAAGLDPEVRPQTVTIEDWLRLSRAVRV